MEQETSLGGSRSFLALMLPVSGLAPSLTGAPQPGGSLEGGSEAQGRAVEQTWLVQGRGWREA